MLALHARRSHAAIARFRRDWPDRPIIVTLTGTDLYQDLATSQEAQRSLELADRLIVLQPKGVEDLPPQVRGKARVIYQSVNLPARAATMAASRNRSLRRSTFDVCVIGHLREVKDSFRAAQAARQLPASSRIRVLQVGGAMDDEMAVQARTELAENPRYRWLGEQPRWRVFRILAQSDLFVLSSKLEGGANALGEAIVVGTPVLASHIAGSVGLLSDDYPGYFPVGDTAALARLMSRAETEPSFLDELRGRTAARAELFEPAHEVNTWAGLLGELGSKLGSRP